jgi:hypothetical protein
MANDQSTGDGDDSREMGIDFGELDDELAAIDYPITREALLEEYGDYEIETSGGSETVQSILGGQEMETEGSETHEYESADEVHQSIFNMIGSEAVGREEYSDRGGSVDDEIGDDVEGEDDEDESL